MRCPECGSPTFVLAIEERRGGPKSEWTYSRRRECRGPAYHRFTTRETVYTIDSAEAAAKQDTRAAALALLAEGNSRRKAAAALRINRSLVERWAREAGLDEKDRKRREARPARIVELSRQGWSQAAIAAELRCARGVVSDALRAAKPRE